jgi:hypothetical protein
MSDWGPEGQGWGATGNTSQPPKQFCLRGHDTYVVGRNSQGRCVACRQMTNRKANRKYSLTHGRYRDRKSPWPRQLRDEPRLAFEPLKMVLDRLELLSSIDCTVRKRWAARGVPVSTVDHICCTMLLRHPSEVYGEDWWGAA